MALTSAINASVERPSSGNDSGFASINRERATSCVMSEIENAISRQGAGIARVDRAGHAQSFGQRATGLALPIV